LVLRVENLKSGYGDRSIVENISFTVGPGQIMALFGHNGAGKSTTLRAILGLLPLSQGSIWLGEQKIDRLSVSDRVELGLRLLPEGRGIFPDLTVAENLAVVVAADKIRAPSAFSVQEVYDLFPILAGKRAALASSLSGGQQQMLALGLSMLGSPRCILLEEPSVGLQPDVVEHLFAQIRTICTERRIAAILIEHKIASALKIVDHVLIFNNGKPVFCDTCEATKNTDIWRYF
jgi:ABC-type branched-subunit amino acid transport system ATPase component